MAVASRIFASDARAAPAMRGLGLIATIAIVLLVSLPMFVARPANLSSDESLYLGEAYAIAHGHGLTYPSGDVVTHRAPLYPLVLAPAVWAGGPDAAYAVSAAIVVIDALLVAAVAWRMAGVIAGIAAATVASAAAFLQGFGTTLYLDPLQCAFMLLTVLALHEAARATAPRWFAAGGVLLGLAFLTKESAVEWAPFGVVAWLALPGLRTRAGARGALLFSLAFVTVVAPWWIWVWCHTSRVFMLGEGDFLAAAAMLAVAVALAAFSLASAQWARLPRRLRARTAAAAPFIAALAIVAWDAFMLYGLTAYSSWPYPNDYAGSIPRYVLRVMPEAQPVFLLCGAWLWVAYRAFRGDPAPRLLVLGAGLFLPFVLFIANRNLQLRDALPLLYLSYVALGVTAAAMLRGVRRLVTTPASAIMLFAAAVVIAAVFAMQQAGEFLTQNSRDSSPEIRADSWNNPFARHIAGWLAANVPAGSNLLSSRLYFSSLYVNTDARFHIRQLPTVRVAIDTSRHDLLVPRSNLFRWGDEDLRPGRPGDAWLYLRQYPGKDYWVGLSEQELLEYIRDHDIDYVVLTGEDVAFSSLAYASYFSAHPAFHLAHTEGATRADQIFVFTVDRAKLATLDHALAIPPASFEALKRATGLDRAELQDRLGVRIRVTDQEVGLSDREQVAALTGADPDVR